jgi:hypothetical protein
MSGISHLRVLIPDMSIEDLNEKSILLKDILCRLGRFLKLFYE